MKTNKASEKLAISALERKLDHEGVLARNRAQREADILAKITSNQGLTQNEVNDVQNHELTDSSATDNWIDGGFWFQSIEAKSLGFDSITVYEIWRDELIKCESLRYRRDSLRAEDYWEIADDVVEVNRFHGAATTQYSISKARLDSMNSRLTQYRRDSRRSAVRQNKPDEQKPLFAVEVLWGYYDRNNKAMQMERLLKRRTLKRRRMDAIERQMPDCLRVEFAPSHKVQEPTFIPDMGGSNQDIVNDYVSPILPIWADGQYCPLDYELDVRI